MAKQSMAKPPHIERSIGRQGSQERVILRPLAHSGKNLAMLTPHLVFCGLTLLSMMTMALAQSASPNGIKILNPAGAISPGSDTWSVGARAGDFIFVAGMQGVDPAINK